MMCRPTDFPPYGQAPAPDRRAVRSARAEYRRSLKAARRLAPGSREREAAEHRAEVRLNWLHAH